MDQELLDLVIKGQMDVMYVKPDDINQVEDELSDNEIFYTKEWDKGLAEYRIEVDEREK